MMRSVLNLAPVVLTVALSGCSRENAGERLTRECRRGCGRWDRFRECDDP
jgi:hypothetical protein